MPLPPPKRRTGTGSAAETGEEHEPSQRESYEDTLVYDVEVTRE